MLLRRYKKDLYGYRSCVGFSTVMSAHRYDDAVFHDPWEDSLFSGFKLVDREVCCDDRSEWFPFGIFSLESFIEPVKSLLDVGFVAIDRSYVIINDRGTLRQCFKWKKVYSTWPFFWCSESGISCNNLLFEMRFIYEVSLEDWFCEKCFSYSYTTSYKYRLIPTISELCQCFDCSFVVIVYDHTSSLNLLDEYEVGCTKAFLATFFSGGLSVRK